MFYLFIYFFHCAEKIFLEYYALFIFDIGLLFHGGNINMAVTLEPAACDLTGILYYYYHYYYYFNYFYV